MTVCSVWNYEILLHDAYILEVYGCDELLCLGSVPRLK